MPRSCFCVSVGATEGEPSFTLPGSDGRRLSSGPVKLIDRVIKVLGEYPAVQFQRDGETVEVPPSSPDGFHVSISSERGTRLVSFEGWHEDFDTDEEALNCFMSGLTPSVRLRVTRRGDRDHKWVLEIREGDRWNPAGAVGLIFFPFWRRRRIVTLQNRWLEAPERAPEN